MKTSSALAIGLTTFVLMFVVFGWRKVRLEEEVATLRGTLARLEEAQQAAPTQGAPVVLAASPVPRAPGSVPDADWSDRLAAIERDMEEMIASQNQSVDELTRLLAKEKKARMRSWGRSRPPANPIACRLATTPPPGLLPAEDGGIEWLQMAVDAPVDLAEVRVRETCNPGAITRSSPNSRRVAKSSSGRAARRPHKRRSIAASPCRRGGSPAHRPLYSPPPPRRASSVRVEVDTRLAAGWEEIDAIALVGRDGQAHWGSSATASSSYADRGVQVLSGGTLKISGASGITVGGTGTFIRNYSAWEKSR